MPDRRSDAASHYEAALQLEPRDAETHYNFANLLAADAANLPEAIRHYEAALHVRPDLGAARNNLAIALYRAGRLDDAIAELENAVSRDASNADAQKNLAKLRAMRAR
jgi:tetratricopeptide (TPR) repeat protein